MVEDAWLHCEGLLPFLLKAKVTGITESGVTYLDEAGTEHTLAADTVIMAVGTRSRKDEAYAFCTPRHRDHCHRRRGGPQDSPGRHAQRIRRGQ